jgi:hypothetical protein
MADKKRWLVRTDDYYALYFGAEPQKTRDGHWPYNRFYEFLTARTVKGLWGITLKTGGGPVELPR